MEDNRNLLLDLLYGYDANDDHQKIAKSKIIDFVKSNKDCFLRTNLCGHITGSCWLLSPDESDVLLTHHKKIGVWLQLGGHADGDYDLVNVALREAFEESGIMGISALDGTIFDVDIHGIPAYKDVPEHFHYDIRFVLNAPHRNFRVSDESNALKWMSIGALALDCSKDISLRRMARKWLKQGNGFK